MNKTLLYFKTWMKATGRNLVSAKVLSLVVLLSAVPYAAFSGNGSLSEVSESMQAGTQTVSGTVQDQDGTPLIGVTVTSSPSNGVVTDVNGKFTIKVPSGAELTFSYLGYKTVKVKVGARTTINVKMESDSQQLEEQVAELGQRVGRTSGRSDLVAVRWFSAGFRRCRPVSAWGFHYERYETADPD